MNDGHDCTVSFGKKFGSATRNPARQVSSVTTIFQRVKCSMARNLKISDVPARHGRALTVHL
jgi:hypothetical protein